MKTRHLLFGAIVFLSLMNYSLTKAQATGYVKQIITVNSGKFETSPPYADYVTVQSYNPQTMGAVNVFNTIYTQSAQSVVIFDKMAYVAAQDSIVKYNLNTMQRVAAIADSGMSQMAIFNGKLIVSKQYPLVRYFVEVLDTSDLGKIDEIPGVSDQCGGITMYNDTLYVAVNGGYLGTRGKIAVIDPATWTLVTEIDLGTGAVGISNLYNYQAEIISVNQTPSGVINSGSISVYNPVNRNFTNILLPHYITAGAGIKDSLLYLGIDNGIGSFNLNSLKIEKATIIPSPAGSKYILSAIVDTLDNRIYSNIGDYSTAGYCLVTGLSGDSITSYETGISSQDIAIDYRSYPSGIASNPPETPTISLFPNPVIDELHVVISDQPDIKAIMVSDINGKSVMMQSPEGKSDRTFSVDCRNMPSGTYCLILGTSKGKLTRLFIKQ
jgi:hypothetical protein